MTRLVLLTVLMLIASMSAAAQPTEPLPLSACGHLAPYGLPRSHVANRAQLCRVGLLLEYDLDHKIPVWVSYTLVAQQTLSCLARADQFTIDPALPPAAQSDVRDYRRSGYDMGHMAPNQDLSWSQASQRNSFALSNIAPQLPSVNRGVWRELEAAVRGWAFNRGALVIYTGTVSGRGSLGDGVNVPAAFWKVVVHQSSGQALAWLVPNQILRGPLASFQTTVAEIERASGVRLPLPDTKTVIRPMWTRDTRPLFQARRLAC